ncbi:tetratricopeptide repeat protein [Actinoplanes xinjiangensis]|uniref:TPR repeat protein n=1 Tax=Actinoplanes xinjiangensis TaxID=512350 RepID=A0A316ECN9_9ACTN|nr:tetratricopeptide repeat protein [Actinoplanes xinjiangensis]PWK27739.1 TPR repeat protein [Actinoplanes xinjiangensis]GIF45178.1 hypothetical protein Axi01nite_94890 [Actinoplanes xinjiangensis]
MNRSWAAWLAGLLVATSAVATGVAVNQAYDNGRLSWPWLVGALLAAIASGYLARRTSPGGHRLRLRAAGARGRPPLLADVTAEQLGVHAGDTPYVSRDVDDRLRQMMHDDHRLVLVHGERLAGASRTAWEAARDALAGHLVLAYLHEPASSLRQLIEQAARDLRGHRGVLWLDGLSALQMSQWDQSLLRDLPDGLRLVATAETAVLSGEFLPPAAQLLLVRTDTTVEVGALSAEERARVLAEPSLAHVRPVVERSTPVLMGRLAGSLGHIERALRVGGEKSFYRIALVRLVTDWQRIGMPRRCDLTAVRDLYGPYLGDLLQDRQSDRFPVLRFRDARRWAQAETADRPRLVDLVRVTGGVSHVPHPLISVVAGEECAGWQPVEALWQYAARVLSDKDRLQVGLLAFDREDYAHASQMLSSPESVPIPAAVAVELAKWLAARGDTTAARRFFRSAIEAGDADYTPLAATKLGVLELRAGDTAAARHWFTLVIGSRHPLLSPLATVRLAETERADGAVEAARRLLTTVAETEPGILPETAMQWVGSVRYLEDEPESRPPDVDEVPVDGAHSSVLVRSLAATNLAHLEQEQGNTQEARHWLTVAADAGHPSIAPRAMYDYAALLRKDGDMQTARDWYVRAVNTGHRRIAAEASYSLAKLEAQESNPEQARRWFRHCIGGEQPDLRALSYYDWAHLENSLGNLEDTRQLYQKAADTDYRPTSLSAALNLGMLEFGQERDDAARLWLNKAAVANSGETSDKAKALLGDLEWRGGNIHGARHWFTEYLKSGRSTSRAPVLFNLGEIERMRNDLGAAERCFTEAAADDNADLAALSMYKLGVVARDQGKFADAQKWWERVIATGHLTYSPRATEALVDLADLPVSWNGSGEPAGGTTGPA